VNDVGSFEPGSGVRFHTLCTELSEAQVSAPGSRQADRCHIPKSGGAAITEHYFIPFGEAEVGG